MGMPHNQFCPCPQTTHGSNLNEIQLQSSQLKTTQSTAHGQLGCTEHCTWLHRTKPLTTGSTRIDPRLTRLRSPGSGASSDPAFEGRLQQRLRVAQVLLAAVVADHGALRRGTASRCGEKVEWP